VLLWAFLQGCAAVVPAGWLFYLCCIAGAAAGPAVQPVLSGCNQGQVATGSGSQIQVFLLLYCGPVLSVTAYLLLLNWLWLRRIPFADLLYRFSATRCATGC